MHRSRNKFHNDDHQFTLDQEYRDVEYKHSDKDNRHRCPALNDGTRKRKLSPVRVDKNKIPKFENEQHNVIDMDIDKPERVYDSNESTRNNEEISIIAKKMKEKISDLKFRTSSEILRELSDHSADLKVYLESGSDLNISDLLSVFESAITSSGRHDDTSVLWNVIFLTKFLEHREISALLTEIVTKVSCKGTLGQEDVLVMISVLSILTRCPGGMQQDAFNTHVSLIKGVISCDVDTNNYEESDFAKLKELLNEFEALTKNIHFEKDSPPFHGMSQTVHKELISLENYKILPEKMIDLRIEIPLEVHVPTASFSNDAHYLKTMFHLYREDFLRSFRRGIQHYITHVRSNKTGKFRDEKVKVYPNVRLGMKRCVNDAGVIQDVHFNTSKVRRTLGRALQYGNLVCFTNLQFQFLTFAMIAHRDLTMLKQGITSVLPLTNYVKLPNKDLVMIESTAFYTAYAHTLEAIKQIAGDLHSHYRRLPFSDQLVSLERHIKEPEYTKNTFGESKYVSFNCLLKNEAEADLLVLQHFRQVIVGNRIGDNRKSTRNIDEKTPLLEIKTWPTQDQLSLDSSQYDALKLALTKRLAIIQGPPGTGKTVIGLKIANFLLNNAHIFSEERPILLVSYTNHALDQFLNGILDFPYIKCQKREAVIRVGSRSDDERLTPYNLKERLRERRHGSTKRLRSRLACIQDNIGKKQKILDTLLNGILQEDFLHDYGVISYEQYLSFQIHREYHFPKSFMICWLRLTEFAETRLGKENIKKRKNDSEEDEIDDEMMKEEDSKRLADDDDNIHTLFFQQVFPKKKIMALGPEILNAQRNLPFVWRKYSYHQRKGILQYIRSQIRIQDVMKSSRARDENNVWKLSISDRWRLYRCWVAQIKSIIEGEIQNLYIEFEELQKLNKGSADEETIDILKRAKLVAFTTTGAAKYMNILRKVEPRIVIVEEAAHMPEQHILGCITSLTEHLILIGDHQQLKPQANDYEMSRTHPILEYSMLERLLKSRIEFQRLSFQHRMRPEISELICPIFYKGLKNHESVSSYEDVKGLAGNLAFINHSEPESDSHFSHSYTNTHEAEFLTRLYKYLLQQGYSYKRITILSLYKDQVRLIRKLVREIETQELSNTINSRLPESMAYFCGIRTKKEHAGVRVMAVDDFQGEENDIILLSLVRSNKEGKLGYVKIPNRMCVALTRAKIGLYVIGNFSILRKNRKWNTLIQGAESRGVLHTSLKLRCQLHPDTITTVSKSDDFNLVPDGGCNEPCGEQLACGHICDLKCHTGNHPPCQKQCKNICNLGHPCLKSCSQPCGPCEEKVLKTIDVCGHKIETKCHRIPVPINCKEPCEKKLSCGHQCPNKCGETCIKEEYCRKQVQILLACGHLFQTTCSQRYDTCTSCTVQCQEILPCGHRCRGNCGWCSNGRLHVPCTKCQTNKCEHWSPNDYLSETLQRCESNDIIRQGYENYQSEVGKICKDNCNWQCQDHCPNRYRCTNKCHEVCSRPRCDTSCQKILEKCGHNCCGLCGEPCPRLCNICHKSELTEIFFGTEVDDGIRFIELQDCGHIFEVSAMDHYMDSTFGLNDCREIIMKICPQCKIPIKKSYRYNNVVKLLQNKTKNAKQTQPIQCQSSSDVTTEMINLVCDIEITHRTKRQFYQAYKSTILSKLNIQKSEHLRQSEESLELVKHLFSKFTVFLESPLKESEDAKETIQTCFLTILRWLCLRRDSFTQFELKQIFEELRRFSLIANFLLLRLHTNKDLDISLSREEKQTVISICHDLETPKKLVDITDIVGRILDKIRGKLETTKVELFCEEDDMMGNILMKIKHRWYECKKGHMFSFDASENNSMQVNCPKCCDSVLEKNRLDENQKSETGNESGVIH